MVLAPVACGKHECRVCSGGQSSRTHLHMHLAASSETSSHLRQTSRHHTNGLHFKEIEAIRELQSKLNEYREWIQATSSSRETNSFQSDQEGLSHSRFPKKLKEQLQERAWLCASRGEEFSMSTAARRRLMRDFKRMQTDPPAGVSASPIADNVMTWYVSITHQIDERTRC